MGVLGWVVLGLLAASLEKTILPRPGATFLGSLVLAWTGAALGGLLGNPLGWGGVSEVTGRSLGLAIAGIILILGGLRVVYRLRGRPTAERHGWDWTQEAPRPNHDRL